jgi:hypothetical protein
MNGTWLTEVTSFSFLQPPKIVQQMHVSSASNMRLRASEKSVVYREESDDLYKQCNFIDSKS